jgi:hypothetical protein
MRRVIFALALTAFVATGAFATEDVTDAGTPIAGDGSWPELFSWGLPDDYCVGLGYDGDNFWVSAGDQGGAGCQFYIYDEFGNLMSTVPQDPGASGWGNRDLAWDDAAGLMFGSYSTMVNAFDPAYTYFNFFIGPENPNRAQAWDGQYHYTANFSSTFWKFERPAWGGVASPMALGVFGSAYGAAYDYMDNVIRISTADYTGDCYVIDPIGFLLGVYTFLPEYDIQGGCTMACTETYGYIYAVLHQFSPDTVSFYDVGHGPSATNQGSWGSIKAMVR